MQKVTNLDFTSHTQQNATWESLFTQPRTKQTIAIAAQTQKLWKTDLIVVDVTVASNHNTFLNPRLR